MPKQIGKVGVVGAGQMGQGIAHVCALAGHDVYLLDLTEEKLAEAIRQIELGLDRQIKKSLITAAQKAEVMKRIRTGIEYRPFAECDLVIESASENEQVKKDVLKKLCPVLPPETLIATNTSSISITRLAAQTDRPGKFAGVHFMNPVPAIQLVEMIRGIATEEDTFQTINAFVEGLGKTTVSAEDFPAFIVHRILMPMINEAVYALYEGVGTVSAIDTAMKLGTNHPMGPLELADFMGLDTCLTIMNMLHDGLADTKYRPCPLLVKYVEAGWLGRKTGRGFYDYTNEIPVPTR